VDFSYQIVFIIHPHDLQSGSNRNYFMTIEMTLQTLASNTYFDDTRYVTVIKFNFYADSSMKVGTRLFLKKLIEMEIFLPEFKIYSTFIIIIYVKI
jgi:hypothetical protein